MRNIPFILLLIFQLPFVAQTQTVIKMKREGGVSIIRWQICSQRFKRLRRMDLAFALCYLSLSLILALYQPSLTCLLAKNTNHCLSSDLYIRSWLNSTRYIPGFILIGPYLKRKMIQMEMETSALKKYWWRVGLSSRLINSGMRVNSQPALEITRALSKLINRNLMLVAPAEDVAPEDKENTPWVPIESFKVSSANFLIIALGLARKFC